MKQLPDKYIRKDIKNAIHNLTVNNPYGSGQVTVPCYDTNIPINGNKKNYVLLSTQTNNYDLLTKCEYTWESTILIDIVTVFNYTGNTGSRELADDILNEVLSRVENLSLTGGSGLNIQRQRIVSINDFETKTRNKIIFRKLLRLSLTIN